MNVLKEVGALVRKDIILEWRSKYALNGILLYVVSTVFVCYQAFKALDPTTWNVLFWIIMLFASINAVNKSFIQESQNRQLYYYTLAGPKAIILSKIIYNVLIMLLLSAIAFVAYAVIFGTPVGDIGLYLWAVIMGGISFASVFTMISGISAKAGNNSTLMAVLSFPIIIPLLIVLIKLSNNAVLGLEWSVSYPELLVLVAINVITVTISLSLFPYLWRD